MKYFLTLLGLILSPGLALAQPALLSPADGANGQPTNLTLQWQVIGGADSYDLQVSTTLDFANPVVDVNTTSAIHMPSLGINTLYYWRVRTVTSGVPSAWSAEITFTTNSETLISGGPLLIASPDTYAFVEVMGPGGVDPCGPTASSTDGCVEVGGNFVYPSLNSTEAYMMFSQGTGTEGVIGPYAPHDFEIRFSAEGSYAYHPFTHGTALWVPFEVWDIGPVGPFGINDPSDDVRMIPNLFSDNGGECELEYGELSDATGDAVFGRPATDRIYAYYPQTTYDAWAAAIAPVVSADTNGCPTSPETDNSSNQIDFGRGRPLQRVIFIDNVDVNGDGTYDGSITNLLDAFIRFYSTPYGYSSPVPSAPIDGATSVPADADLFWSGIGGDSYQVQVSTDPAFGTVVFDGNASEPVIRVNPPLVPNTMYYWRVRDLTGMGGDWSATWSFTAIEAQGFDCNNVTEIPVSECEVLATFFNTTNGPNWSENAGWLVTNRPCSWFGITCGAGRIEGIDLYNNQLTGPIPAELGSLSNLTSLDLGTNQLTGALPLAFGNLSSLSSLYLSFNQLEGSIPAELGNLSNLTRINMADNQFTGSIPPEIGNLSELRTLSLGRNDLTGSIPAALGNLSRLTELYLFSNELTGSIPPELGNLPELRTLSLSGNDLTGSIPAALGNLSNLIWLSLTDNDLTGSIPAALGNLSGLGALSLDRNQLTGSIPAALGDLSDLTSLHLENNQLSGVIPAELGNLSNLTWLYLRSNQLSGDVPLDVAQLGVNLSLCFFTNNPDLCMPNTPPFQSLGNPICNVSLGGPNCSVPLTVTPTALLHGAYTSGGTMRADLSAVQGFPLNQPFNASPWNYEGAEKLSTIPASVVDWVLVSLRQFKTQPGSVVGQRAALMLEDGRIVDVDGISPVHFSGVADGLYYLWIQHRSHLGIMSASQLNVSPTTNPYSFTTGQDRALGTLPMVELADGVFGLWGGDGNASGDVTASDFLNVWLPDNGNAGYLAADFNMDGQVTAFDFLLVWLVSNGQSSQVPN